MIGDAPVGDGWQVDIESELAPLRVRPALWCLPAS